jgi:hypothetical protein
MFASKQDTQAYQSMERFLAATHPPLQAFSLVAPAGGHNLKAILSNLPQILDWLSSHLATGSGLPPKLT